jgi:hypothetical protein
MREMTKRSRRFFLAVAIVITLGMLVSISVRYVQIADFRKAAAWHKTHGDILLIDGHRLRLPQDWWQQGAGQDGMPRVFKASDSISKASQTVIDFSPKGPKEWKRGGEEVRQTLEFLVAHQGRYGDETLKTSLLVVTAASTRMYCLRKLIAEDELGLRCDVVDGVFVISSAGPPDTEKEVLSILSTFD